MALHTRKKMTRPGLPEIVALILIVLALICTTAWWRDVNEPEWGESEGRILTCNIHETHYNAQDYRPKVTMEYEYSVGSQEYTGSFTGFWPAVGNANALPTDRFNELTDKSFGLLVFYEPGNPANSKLDVVGANNEFWLGGAALASLVLAVLYYVKVYPAWRARY